MTAGKILRWSRALVLLLVVLIVIAAIITALSQTAATPSPTPWPTTLISIIQIGVQLLIALWIAYYVNTSTSSEAQRRELLLQMIKRVEEKTSDAFDAWRNYTEEPTKQRMEVLLFRLKRASADLGVLIGQMKLRGEEEFLESLGHLKLSLFDVKTAWTESIYPEKTAMYSTDYIRLGFRSYDTLLMRISACKLRLFE